MKLPPPATDLEYAYAREHDLDEIWEPSRKPHAAASHAGRFTLLRDLVQAAAPPPARILDVGCAQGTLGLQLAEAGYRVTLLDVRHPHIDYARARYEKGEVRFVVGELSAETPTESDFDMVVCTEVLEHVSRPAVLLASIVSKVRRGGVVLLTTPNAQYHLSTLPHFSRAPQELIDATEPNSRDGDAHRYLFTREELVTLVRSVGLAVERTGFFVPFWLEGHLKTRLAHRAHFRFRGRIARISATPKIGVLGRFLCSSQFLVARQR